MPVCGFEDSYRISNFGRVLSLKRFGVKQRIIKSHISRHGYKRVILSLISKKHRQIEIARMFGVCRATITFIKQNKTWSLTGNTNKKGETK